MNPRSLREQQYRIRVKLSLSQTGHARDMSYFLSHTRRINVLLHRKRFFAVFIRKFYNATTRKNIIHKSKQMTKNKIKKLCMSSSSSIGLCLLNLHMCNISLREVL